MAISAAASATSAALRGLPESAAQIDDEFAAAPPNASASASDVEPGHPNALAGLLAFHRLDLLLAAGVEEARQRYGPAAADDSYRGFYVSEEQVQRALHAPVAEPLVASRPAAPILPGWDRIAADNPRWAWLRDRYDLTEAELDVVLIALGPDVDRRYEQLYAYLQDDVSARRPTVNLALDLLTVSPAKRIAAMEIFAADAPLVSHHLVSLTGDRRADDAPLIARLIAVDEQITATLLGLLGLDHRLGASAGSSPRLRVPRTRVGTNRTRGWTGWSPWWVARGAAHLSVCAFTGPRGRDDAGRPSRSANGSADRSCSLPGRCWPASRLPPIFCVWHCGRRSLRTPWCISRTQAPCSRCRGRGSLALSVDALAAHPGVVVLGTAQAWRPSPHEPLGVIGVPFTAPAANERRRIWRREVDAAGAGAAPGDLAAVGDRVPALPAADQGRCPDRRRPGTAPAAAPRLIGSPANPTRTVRRRA